MSKTNYSKKFIYTGLSFKRTSFSQEDNEKTEVKNKTSKDSWKFFKTFKEIKNLKRVNSFQNINNILLSPHKSNPNYVPITDKYSILKFNKAPTLGDNKKEINKIIKKKKLKKIEDFNNIFNTILINESKVFRSNLYITGGGLNTFRSNSQSIILDRNQSKENGPQQKKYKSIYQNNNSSLLDRANINIETGLNSNSLYNESNVFNENRKNNSKIIYPFVNNSNMSFIIKQPDIENSPSFKGKDLYNDIKIRNISKLRMEINDAIFNNLRFRGEFSKLEKKMIKFKIFQNIQDTKVKAILSKEEYHIEKKYNNLIKLKKKLAQKYIIYSKNMNNYLEFLSDKIKEIKADLKKTDLQIKNYIIQLEKIILDIVKKQNELESLVDKRNFLIQIKEKFKSPQIHYQELLIKDSKKLYIGNYFLTLDILKQTKNKIIIDFIGQILDIKRKIKENILNKDNLEPDFYISSSFYKLNPVFESVEDFIHLYNYLKEKSINYLIRAENEKKAISKIKRNFEENYLTDNDYLEDEILEKENEKIKLLYNHKILVDTYDYYKNNILKKINDITIKTLDSENKINQKRFINLDNELKDKYEKQIKKYKYGGILLFKNLVKYVKFFSQFKYDKSQYYLNLFDDRKLDNALNVNVNEFNDDNIRLIDRYLVILASKYEKVCKYIMNRHQIFLLNEKNKKIIESKKNEINEIRRIHISNEIKNLIKKKKNEEIKKIIEKSSKSIAYLPNRKNYENYANKNKAKREHKEKIISFNKKNYLENEFNELVKFNDDNDY